MMKAMWLLIIITLLALLAQALPVSQGGAEATAPEVPRSAEPQSVEVVFETTLGTFTLALDALKAPDTVANFLAYVDAGFYDNTLFHRVVPGFVVQGGGFDKALEAKPARAPVKNESGNSLKNTRGTIAMARRTHPDTATSQFFINLADNTRLDYKAAYQPGYTVFGRVSDGMHVIDEIARQPTGTRGRFKDLPSKDILVLAARRKVDKAPQASASDQERFTAGEHYIVLDKPVATRDSSKIEVVEMFSYGCPHCYEFEPLLREWRKQQGDEVDFWWFPAVWNKPMALYARAFYAASEMNVEEIIHHPLFTAIVIEQRKLSNESELADFFTAYGIDKDAFTKAFHSSAVDDKVKQAEARVRDYKPAGVPEIIVNGKYRIDRMRAGGQAQMLAVLDFLIDKERAALAE